MGLYEKAVKIIKERDKSHFSKKAALRILEVFPREKEYVLEAGLTPSGKIHLGNYGDVLVTESVGKVLEYWGYRSKRILAIDSRDPFRRPPVFLPEDFKSMARRYIGRPLDTLPDPFGCHKNFVQHFVEPFVSSLDSFGLKPKIVYANEIHTDGRYIELLRGVIIRRDHVREILNMVHERAGHAKRYSKNWIPYRPLCGGCGRIDENVIPVGVSDDGYLVEYKCGVCGFEGVADIRKAEGKPPWRIDWVLRWVLFNVHFEPMGKDLMAAGSSYDSGRELIRNHFGREPPVTIFYDFFYWVEPGRTPEKFSKRHGIGLAPHEWLLYAPPEVLNYLLLKRHVGDIEKDSLRHVDFSIYDIPRYVDRFDADEQAIFQALKKGKLTSDEKKAFIAYFLALVDHNALRRGIRRVPYTVAMEIAVWMESEDDGMEMLKRTGVLPKDATVLEFDDARGRLRCAKNFIQKFWSPPRIDIEAILSSLSKIELKALITVIGEASKIDPNKLDQQTLREIVNETSRRYEVKKRRIYEMLYMVALGRKTGPQAFRLFRKEFSRENLMKVLKCTGRE